MTHALVLALFVVGVFVAAWLIWAAALVISDTAHRMRGDIRCTPGCSCRGTDTGRPRP